MDVGVFRGKSYILLQVDESLIWVAFYLQTFGSFEVWFGVLLVEVDGNWEVLDSLGEITKTGKYDTSQVKIFGDVVLTLLYGFVHIRNGFAEILKVE